MAKQVLEKNYGKLISGSVKSNYNIAPGYKMAIREEGNEFLTWSNWGLIPYNSKQIKEFEKLSCLEIGNLKSVINKNSKRCIIPANAYFDWENEKNPQLFQYPRNPHFAFAGICESWDIGNGKQIHSFAVLKCASQNIQKEMQDTIPVAMSVIDSRNWLENDEIDVNDTKAFMLDPNGISISPASDKIIGSSLNDRSLLKKGNSVSSGENYKLF